MFRKYWREGKSLLKEAGITGSLLTVALVGLFALFVVCFFLGLTVSAALVYVAWNWVAVGLFKLGPVLTFWPECFGIAFLAWVVRTLLGFGQTKVEVKN